MKVVLPLTFIGAGFGWLLEILVSVEYLNGNPEALVGMAAGGFWCIELTSFAALLFLDERKEARRAQSKQNQDPCVDC